MLIEKVKKLYFTAIYWVDITVVLRHLCLFKFQISRYLWFSLIVLKYWVESKVKLNSAVWSFSAIRFSIYSAVWSIIQPSGFLFIRPSDLAVCRSPIVCPAPIHNFIYNCSNPSSPSLFLLRYLCKVFSLYTYEKFNK